MVIAEKAADVCARFALPAQARPLLQDGMGPQEFLQAAVAKKQYAAAIDFLAYGLPPRASIWWGCLCTRHAYGDSLSAADRAACRAAVQWIAQPSEPNRAAAKAPSEAAGPASPAGTLAGAVFQTNGNAWPKAVSNAVKLAAIKNGPAGILTAQRDFIELGIWVAEGNT